ncbi:glycerophosphodiester phosphodiesterase [Janibacter limosus]|uniref:glycerophosphodiester phosphodiesterase n=1 Tax=Janibacter limosus TaxID=53458 RepID=UPI001F5F1D94|nr:glycerophosphodiester phosphodiesterase [Janibacter limosus]
MHPTEIATGVLAAVSLVLPAATATAAPTAPSQSTTQSVSGNPGYREKDMSDPLVLAHRGASGYRPEHTLAAYDLAVEQGADYIEPDLVMTKDGVLVDRHEPEIGGTTDVADRPEFADRRTTKQVDGASVTGWFVDDFTLAELKTLRTKERLGDLRPGSSTYDGQFQVPTFEEVLAQREALSRSTGRVIGIIPEIKHSTYLHAEGFDPEAEVTRLVKAYHLDHRKAPIWVQSFELTALKSLREHGYRGKSTFLTTVKGGPYDLREQGTTYAELTTAASMQELSQWIDGFGPEKNAVIARNADGTLGEPTSFVDDAHAAGLKVTPWTFRAENTFLPTDYRTGSDPATHGRMADEVTRFFEVGVDGVFCDQPDICVGAREDFLDAS